MWPWQPFSVYRHEARTGWDMHITRAVACFRTVPERLANKCVDREQVLWYNGTNQFTGGTVMAVFQKKNKKRAAIEKELAILKRKETRLVQSALKAVPPRWKEELKKKVPKKVYCGLESAFEKAFSLVFTQGLSVIERTYNRQSIEENHSVRDYAVMIKGGRRELKQLKRNAGRSGLGNTALTTVEGIGLGVLGIGLPDIVLFVGMLLKGVYETALSYGFPYDTPKERLLILHMLEAALTKGEAFTKKDAQVEQMLNGLEQPSEDKIQLQIQKTASAFAVDMLLLKFVQGIPVVGVLGGAANPVYYNKVMRYVQLKYQKRYLQSAAQRSGMTL